MRALAVTALALIATAALILAAPFLLIGLAALRLLDEAASG
ncbi:MAG TPA: hypothetical protein VIV12_00830 [Streptosporangiaceae bacterium]